MSTDYEDVVSYLLKNGDLWEDPDFQAVQGSLFYHQPPPHTFQWKRPHEITSNPLFVADSFEIVNGRLGDKWLAACLGCLRTSEGLLYRVVPADQGFDDRHDYVGIFRFRIWWCGEWKEVLVDDRLPTLNGKLAFIHAKGSSPFWPALLEKAYAKLHGSYEALKYGTTMDGLSDLTGGIAESIALSDESTGCIQILGSLLKMTTMVTAKVHREQTTKELQPATTAEKLANGIVTGDSYRIYSMQKIETMHGERATLLRIKSTAGVSSHSYVGDWSSTSMTSWQSVDPVTRERLSSLLSTEGEFWMSYNDWLRTFTHVEAIHLDADTARDEPSLLGKTPWILRLYHGRWQKGVTAGGCRNNTETFHMNPRLSLSLHDSDEVVLALNQHAAVDPKVIGFTGYPLPSAASSSQSSNSSSGSHHHGDVNESALGKAYFRSKKSLLNSQYTNSKQVSLRLRMDAGQVVVLPTTFEPGEESAFTFRVFSRAPGLRMRIVDVVPAIVGSVFAKSVSQQKSINGGGNFNSLTNGNSASNNKNAVTKDFGQYEPIFKQMSEDKRTVNAFELQDLLEACLPNDYIKSCASIEVCRQIIVAFDSTGLGRITFANFKDLMCSLKVWHNVFKNWTKEKSGILKSERLKESLLEVGFQLNTAILSTLMYRYIRKDGTLRFGDFVAMILNLSVAFDAFDKRDIVHSGTVKVGRTEWLKVALTC